MAAAGNITLNNFSVGHRLPDTNISNALVAGGNLKLTNGGVWGDARYGGTYSADTTVVYPRGTRGAGHAHRLRGPVAELRSLSAQLAALTANGTTRRENWGGIMLRGTNASLNVFDVAASAFTGAVLRSIEAPAGSLVVVNIRGASATFTGLRHLVQRRHRPECRALQLRGCHEPQRPRASASGDGAGALRERHLH